MRRKQYRIAEMHYNKACQEGMGRMFNWWKSLLATRQFEEFANVFAKKFSLRATMKQLSPTLAVQFLVKSVLVWIDGI